ncbi:MAG: hypothetical protein GWP19_13155 [Planctomycetia bacterium]|nr:hypothetical protein [Planctomycetia bacterium]
MPIIPLLKINEKAIKAQLNTLFNKIGIANLSELEKLILNIPKNIVGFTLKDWQVNEKHLGDITERSFTKSRMANNIIDLNNDDILWVFKEIY